MKNLLKRIIIIAMVTGLALSMINCSEEEPVLINQIKGDTLILAGQVQTSSFNMEGLNISITYNNFKGNLDVEDLIDGDTGTVRNGKLSFTKGKPDASFMISIEEFLETLGAYINIENIENIEIDNSSAKVYSISGFAVDDEDYFGLTYTDIKINTSNMLNVTADVDMVSYIYSDSAVRITAEEMEIEDMPMPDISLLGFSLYEMEVTFINKKVDISLKPGWNPIYVNLKMSMGIISGKATITATSSINNPKLRWVLTGGDMLGGLPFGAGSDRSILNSFLLNQLQK